MFDRSKPKQSDDQSIQSVSDPVARPPFGHEERGGFHDREIYREMERGPSEKQSTPEQIASTDLANSKRAADIIQRTGTFGTETQRRELTAMFANAAMRNTESVTALTKAINDELAGRGSSARISGNVTKELEMYEADPIGMMVPTSGEIQVYKVNLSITQNGATDDVLDSTYVPPPYDKWHRSRRPYLLLTSPYPAPIAVRK